MSEAPIALIPKSPGEVAKALIYIALTALAILQTSLSGGVTLVEIIQIAVAVVGLIPVYLLAGTLVKTLTAAGLAAAQALVLILVNVASIADVPLGSWIGVIIAAFAAIGIAVVPNSSPFATVTALQVADFDYEPKHSA